MRGLKTHQTTTQQEPQALGTQTRLLRSTIVKFDDVDTPPDVNTRTAGFSGKVRACLDFQQITDKDASAGTVTATSGCAGTINPPEVNATISGPGNADTPSVAVSEGSGDDGNEPGFGALRVHYRGDDIGFAGTAASSPIETVVSCPRTVTGLSSDNTTDSCEARDFRHIPAESSSDNASNSSTGIHTQASPDTPNGSCTAKVAHLSPVRVAVLSTANTSKDKRRLRPNFNLESNVNRALDDISNAENQVSDAKASVDA
ncbi:uncharacterized protein FSUBG_12013 [Fusarium subglutinans]|uniref:Uncharacterized protein n=1 Tax=Gibberella subglutinans TaxID=42677 RepID=A0A8H5L8U3_GIBSU|nr:uncharacterized protein FSUBG_12013 [Fusarium subglutinans]KAF5586802.1 hypothetical protein FSUBG_12013 [Fusarium subglutinans]